MNRFNKMIFMGLLSIVAGATSVKGSTAPLEVGADNSKFFVMASPNADLMASSIESAKKNQKVTNFITVPTELELNSVVKSLEKVTSKDVVCAKIGTKAHVTKYSQLDDTQKTKLAILYACWLIKANNEIPYAAIQKATADLKLSELTEDQKTLIELYFIEQNKDLLKSIEKAHTSFFGRNAGKIAKIATAVAVLGSVALIGFVIGLKSSEKVTQNESTTPAPETLEPMMPAPQPKSFLTIQNISEKLTANPSRVSENEYLMHKQCENGLGIKQQPTCSLATQNRSEKLTANPSRVSENEYLMHKQCENGLEFCSLNSKTTVTPTVPNQPSDISRIIAGSTLASFALSLPVLAIYLDILKK